MSSDKQAVLDAFGRVLVENVRDEACRSLQSIISGRMRGHWAKALFREYRDLDPASKVVLHRFLLEAVDAAIVQFLNMLDSNPSVSLLFQSLDGEKHEMQVVSDGLVGEVHNENGWFARFSKFKRTIEPLA